MLLSLWADCKGNLVDDLRRDERFPKSPDVSQTAPNPRRWTAALCVWHWNVPLNLLWNLSPFVRQKIAFMSIRAGIQKLTKLKNTYLDVERKFYSDDESLELCHRWVSYWPFSKYCNHVKCSFSLEKICDYWSPVSNHWEEKWTAFTVYVVYTYMRRETWRTEERKHLWWLSIPTRAAIWHWIVNLMASCLMWRILERNGGKFARQSRCTSYAFCVHLDTSELNTLPLLCKQLTCLSASLMYVCQTIVSPGLP